MAERTRTSTEAIRFGRLKKAAQFLDAAIVIDDEMPDASVSLLVNAGIAAADVICGARAWVCMPRERAIARQSRYSDGPTPV